MKIKLTAFRPLPAVAVVAVLLLGLKGEGLVRTALAEEHGETTQVAALAPPPTDIAAEGENESAGIADVDAGLAKRHAELDARAAAIDERAKLLKATENRIEGKIATLKKLQDDINVLLGKRDEEEQKQLTALVKTYTAMKAKNAARIFNNLDDAVLVPVAAAMKADALAPVLANMESEKAKALTVKLAARLRLPKLAAPSTPEPDPRLICTPQDGSKVELKSGEHG